MTIVFGTTLRPQSEPLAELAGLLSVRLQVPLRLVHVSDDPRAPLVLGTDHEHLLGTVRDDLARLAEQVRSRTGAEVHPHLAAGPVVDALSSLSQFDLATALVVGRTMRRLRNVPERLVRASRVPVIVLREPERLSAWLHGEKRLRVLVGADLGRAAQAARAFAATLAKLGSIEVEVAFVASPEEMHARLGLAPPDGELSPEAESAIARELSLAAPEDETSATLRVIGGHGRADAHLVARADQGGFDLIIVGQRRRSLVQQVWHGSIARGVLQASPVSVASVPVPIGEVDASFRPPRVVVVGADFSEVDRRALAHAVGHAADGAVVHIAHVLVPGDVPSELRQAREDARHQLAKLERSVVSPRASVSIETHVLDGRPAEQLLALSERVGADLLVLGVRKRTTLDRALMGSVAQAIVEDSRFPMLLVPERSL